jgi:hypothetical protein
MFRSQRTTANSLTAVLRALPRSVTVFDVSDAWLVVGPSGLFVLTEDDGDLTAAALRAAARADSVRLRLSDELVWVPFVDAMCVTADTSFDSNQPCLVVPHDVVAQTVTGGPVSVDAETLEKLRLLAFPVLG